MSIAIVTGSAGLIGCEAARHFARLGMDVIGIDNDMRREFFGDDASTERQRDQLVTDLGRRYSHADFDIRDEEAVERLFSRYSSEITLVIHTAAQPSHDWAARAPKVDFSVNATGTLNLLEATRHYAPDAPFIFTSSNKVYGDAPNQLPLIEHDTRWEIDPSHTYAAGIREDMSKVSADLLVQEYGRYFGLKTVCFRGGCLTGPHHAGTKLHGFLAYLIKCVATGTSYTVFGYGGKQVRDNIHSGDLIRAFEHFYRAPRSGEVYNIGGGRFSNCSVREAIAMCQRIVGRELSWEYRHEHRIGDHMWWISDNSKFLRHYPDWRLRHDVESILQGIHEANVERWADESVLT
jgi:CDP-paratose 2-epimerase